MEISGSGIKAFYGAKGARAGITSRAARANRRQDQRKGVAANGR